MINDIFAFFNNLLATGSSVVDFGSATAGDVANTVLGSVGLPGIGVEGV
ncbi:hypothetical protein ACWGLC_14535 [Dietzia sp. NPDC055877]